MKLVSCYPHFFLLSIDPGVSLHPGLLLDFFCPETNFKAILSSSFFGSSLFLSGGHNAVKGLLVSFAFKNVHACLAIPKEVIAKTGLCKF